MDNSDFNEVKIRIQNLEQLQDSQYQVLHSMARGEDLSTILNKLINCIEDQYPKLICSILLLDKEDKQLFLAAAPSLPSKYNNKINGIYIGPEVGSCGTAAYLGKEIIVTDINNDPLWNNYKDLALKYNLQACWSVPIKSGNKVLGTFAIYCNTPKAPTDEEIYLIRYGAKIAQIAIEQKQTIEKNLTLQKHLLHLQKMDAIGLFAASLAHDLNNTLNILQGHLELIQINPEATPEIKRSASMALEGSESAANLTKQLSGFSAKSTLTTELVELHQLLNDNLKYINDSLNQKIKLCLDYCLEPIFIKCDPQQIKQVLTNIFLNAERALEAKMPGCQEMPRMDIKLSTKQINNPSEYNHSAKPGKYVICEIKDNGTGISCDNLDKIFEPFYTTKQEQYESGLGLSTSYGIMQKHKGWIEVNSIINQGTSVSLLFPITKQKRESITHHQKKSTFECKQILVVDDNVMLTQVTLQILERKGFDAVGFTEPLAALKWFSDNYSSVSTAILDVQMPVLNGEQLFYELKKIKPDLRTIFISAYSQTSVAERLLSKGAYKFFQKPIKFKELVKTLESTNSESKEKICTLQI